MEEIQDQVILEQLLNTFLKDMGIFVREESQNPAQCFHGVLQLAHMQLRTIPLVLDILVRTNGSANITAVLLAHALQGCRGLLSQLCNLPNIILSAWSMSTTNVFASFTTTFQTHCYGY